MRRQRRDSKHLGHELLDAAGVEVGGPNPWDIHIGDDRFFNRVFRDRELGLGEAYQEGWWDAERVDDFLIKVQLADLASHLTPGMSLRLLAARSHLLNRQNRRRARVNVNAHYDIGNDLYERMLDHRMIYSCAYWDGVNTLEAAQEAKLDLICRKLHLEPGMSLLDIGCGWGGLAAYAAEKFGAVVTGISPSVEQVEHARDRCAGSTVEIHQLDYRDVEGTYDRVVSIGMMEHVGPKNYTAFFHKCRDRLTPDGVMLHHTIGSNESKQHTDPWFDKYIFPGGVLPSLAQIGEGAGRDWAIEDVHNFGPDYDRTLMAWSANIEARWGEIPHYDEKFRRTWHYYLMGSAAAFRIRNLQLWQIVFRRSNLASDTYVSER